MKCKHQGKRITLREVKDCMIHCRKLTERKLKGLLRKGVVSREAHQGNVATWHNTTNASISPFASPILLVKKKDGTWRFCVDYRHLNSIIVKNTYPLPVVDELFDELHGAKWFTQPDRRYGSHQIRVLPYDKIKTTFKTHNGH
jgi:hypothetical protein